MQYKALHTKFLSVGLLLMPAIALGHAGNLDLNGGHYYGSSYHCHLRGCEMPDTVGIDRTTSDTFSTDRRTREKFFNTDDWDFEVDFDNDCQSTRQELLILTSRAETRYTNPRNCVVRSGEWLDEYTGKIFKVAVKVDVDHIIPLMYAHTHGGDRWPAQKKLQFANDPLNLVLADKKEIKKKRDRGPGRYLPPRKEFHCEYAGLWKAVADKYDLYLESRDRKKITQILDNCED